MKKRTMLVIGSALLAISCTKPAAAPPAASDTRSALEAAIRDVRAVTAARAAAVESGNVEGALEAYVEDAVWLPSHSEEFVGKELARAKLKPFFESVQVREEQQEDEHVLLAPDALLERGNYAVEMTLRQGGDVVADAGTYMTIWRKGTDAKWRIAYQMWTSHRSLGDAITDQKGAPR